jgi:PAS domain S-box-containing protein
MDGLSSEKAGFDRGWLEAVLDLLPTPMAIIGPRGEVAFANRAADALAGGRLPRTPEDRARGGFAVTDPSGQTLEPDELPSARVARGETVDQQRLEWHTPAGVRSLLVQSARLPAAGGEPETTVLSFEDVSGITVAERAKTESLALLDALFESAPVGLGYFDRELRYERVNDKLARINGVPVEEHIGRTVTEVLPAMDERVEQEFHRVLETGVPAVDIEFVGETPAAAGEERRFSCAIYPVRDADGSVTGIGIVVLDITARRRAEAERERAHELEREARATAEEMAARARFLAESSMILDESLDYEATLKSVSRLAVPWLADWCVIDMVEPDGAFRRMTVAHVDPEKIELAEEWSSRYPTDPDAPTGVPNVARTGKSEIYPDIPDELLVQTARDEEHLALIRSLGMRSVMIVPMIARGRTLGVITFIASDTGRRYSDDDVLLAEELARRAATSVDNARLYTERSYIARTLQQSLLPPHLPEIPGLEVAGRYRPAGEGNEVGGDFYDVFQIAGDSWAVVIGDVCGKGADAAALTALVRYTIRAIASAEKRPSEVLRLLNDAILRQRTDNRFCTVAYARVTKRGDGVVVDLSSGGHPLPLIARASGDAEYAGEPGTLLGVVPDPDLRDVTVELGPGDSFVLYTDGITEAGAPTRLLTPEDLCAEIKRCGPGAASDVAECLEATAVEASGGEPNDDIAVVVLQVSPDRSGTGFDPARLTATRA